MNRLHSDETQNQAQRSARFLTLAGRIRHREQYRKTGQPAETMFTSSTNYRKFWQHILVLECAMA